MEQAAIRWIQPWHRLLFCTFVKTTPAAKCSLSGFPVFPVWPVLSHKLTELFQDITILGIIPMHAHDSDYQMLYDMGQLRHVCGTLAAEARLAIPPDPPPPNF